MPNIFQRALSLFYKPSNQVLVQDRFKYIQDRQYAAINGSSNFDFKRPELASTIYTCVQLISNNISKLKLNVYRKNENGREIYTTHPWQETLSYNPDLRLSTAKWLNYTVTKMLLEGGVYYLRSDFDNNLTPKKELKELGCVKKVVASEGEIYYQFEGIEGWIASKNLLFFYIFSKDSVTPISPIEALKNELSIQAGAENTISNFYKNGLFQILFIEADLEAAGPTDKNKAKEYFEKIQNEVTGSHNAFAGGVMKIPPMYKLKSIPMPQLDFLSQSRFTEGRIAAIYNVPAFYLNISEGAGGNYSKVEMQQLNFLNNCLSNITNIILQELNHKLLSNAERSEGVEIDFDYSGLYSLDLESKSIYLKNLFSMGTISPNEARVQMGFDKVDNEFMNYNWLQSQNQPIQKYDSWKNNKIQPEAPKADGETKSE
jgi:HK97 family phage portal protein